MNFFLAIFVHLLLLGIKIINGNFGIILFMVLGCHYSGFYSHSLLRNSDHFQKIGILFLPKMLVSSTVCWLFCFIVCWFSLLISFIHFFRYAYWMKSKTEYTCYYIFFADRNNWKAYLLFFLLPVGIHVIINCILFIITAIYCNRMKRDIHRLKSDEMSTSTKRRKFNILKTMFVLMFYLPFLCLHIWVQ